MIHYKTSKSSEDLSEIITLQKSNLLQNLREAEMQQQGFLTVAYTLDELKKMHAIEVNIVAKDNHKIVGYVLAMTKKSRADIPILIPMFDCFDKIKHQGKLISGYNYIVVGQVCIDKEYRGKGLFDGSYKAYKNRFKNKYDFAITEIATTNKRSRAAHQKIGFEEIHTYKDFNETEWRIVIWDWNAKGKG